MSDNRAEQALRSALAGQEIPPTPDPQIIRRRVRDRRVGIVALASALILLVSAGAFVAADLGREQQQIVAAPGAARLPADPAPDGWRTEYYRDISFEVPDDLGVRARTGIGLVSRLQRQPARAAAPPAVRVPRPEARSGHRRLASTRPTGLTSEHVLVYKLAPDDDASTEVGRDGAYWSSPEPFPDSGSSSPARTRRWPAGSPLRSRPVQSSRRATPSTRWSRTNRPDRTRRSTWRRSTMSGSMVICQYEAGEEDAPAGPPGGGSTGP